MATIRPQHVKVICPTAPTMPVTLNAGFRMPSWFDLKTLDSNGPEDEDGTRIYFDCIKKTNEMNFLQALNKQQRIYMV